MTYTLVEIDDLTQRAGPIGTDKILIKTAAGIDQHALLQDILGIGTDRDSQTFTNSSSPVLNILTFTYEVGEDQLDVIFNGSSIFDYTETDTMTVTLWFSPIPSDKIRVVKRWVPPV